MYVEWDILLTSLLDEKVNPLVSDLISVLVDHVVHNDIPISLTQFLDFSFSMT